MPLIRITLKTRLSESYEDMNLIGIVKNEEEKNHLKLKIKNLEIKKNENILCRRFIKLRR